MSNEIDKALAQMILFMEDEVAETSLEYMDAAAKKIAKETTKVYQDFFAELEQLIIDIPDKDDDTSPPPSLIPFTPGGRWAPLSQYWMEVKSFYNKNKKGRKNPLGFYHGISRRRKNNRKLSFQDYVSSLAGNPVAVNNFFGPSSLRFDVSKAGRKFSVSASGDKVIYTRTGPTQEEKPFTRTQNAKPFEITATVTAFPRLLGTNFDERSVINEMMKRIGGRGKKQFVKIYGSRGHDGTYRPLRPIITPLILWNLDQINKAMQKAF